MEHRIYADGSEHYAIPGAYWRHTGRKEQPHSPTVIEVVERSNAISEAIEDHCVCIWLRTRYSGTNHTHTERVVE